MPAIHQHEAHASSNIEEAMAQHLYMQLRHLVYYLNSWVYHYLKYFLCRSDTVHHECKEHRQDSISGGELQAQFHHIPHWVLDADLEWGQLHLS